MCILKDILIKILSESENEIIEMAFTRKELINKITDQSISLLDHILNILYFQTYSDWDQTIQDIYDNLYSLLRVKKHKKFLSKEKLFELLFEKPFVDENEELTNEYLKNIIKAKEKSKKMKVKHIPTYKEVKQIYEILVDKLWNLEYLDRNDIRQIIKIK